MYRESWPLRLKIENLWIKMKFIADNKWSGWMVENKLMMLFTL